MTNRSNIPSLHEVYKDHFLIGAAVTPHTIQSQGDLLKKHFNSITAENEMKPITVQPQEGQFNFDDADKLMAFAEANNMHLRGHTLVWHGQTGHWMFENEDGSEASREKILQRMKDHIDTVVKRYKGRIYCWDVVNEAIEDKTDTYLRESKWLKLVGEDFIAKAFQYAHEADEDALLFYNDYNESNPIKREKIYKLVKSLLDQDVPIHGVGLQAHWNIHGPELSDIRAAIELYASLGLKLHLTEMDISVFKHDDKRTDLTEPTEEMLELQAKRYEQVFEIFREYKDVITNVTFWGAADDYTWLDNFPVRGRKNWPFVFDTKQQPKESFWKITEF